jgi:hypothetical protein
MPCGDNVYSVFLVDNYSKRSLIEATAFKPGVKGGDDDTWVAGKPVFGKKLVL